MRRSNVLVNSMPTTPSWSRAAAWPVSTSWRPDCSRDEDPMIEGLDHIVLIVRDVERSVTWYRDRLGLEPARLHEFRPAAPPFTPIPVTVPPCVAPFPA